jgi:hypothetical protein
MGNKNIQKPSKIKPWVNTFRAHTAAVVYDAVKLFTA